MKTAFKIAVGCAAVSTCCMLVIHRRVIAACIKGEPMPEPPEWHKKCFPCCFKAEDDVVEEMVEDTVEAPAEEADAEMDSMEEED